ncbi:sulfite exporter TauE/SafE family protein, partial [Pseudomonas aeruginosa]|nr:sulfite exporter TauE/SafE family protein [Pseudomonas aeruginosa]
QGWSVAQAAPIGLLAVALSTLIGTIEGLFKKIVRYRAAIWIALIGTPMAHIGILIANAISPVWLKAGAWRKLRRLGCWRLRYLLS